MDNYTPPRKNVILVRDALSFRRGIRILWLWQKIEAWKREKNGPGVPREFVVVFVFVFFFSAQRSKGNTRNVREKSRHLILRRHSINGFVGRCDWVVRALRRRGRRATARERERKRRRGIGQHQNGEERKWVWDQNADGENTSRGRNDW